MVMVIALEVFLSNTGGGWVGHHSINEYIMAKPNKQDEQKGIIGHSADSWRRGGGNFRITDYI